MNARFINCEACHTEGRILTNDGGPDDVDHGICPECNGERVVEVETRPMTEAEFCDKMFAVQSYTLVRALDQACNRLQSFLDTFGDLGDCVTQADLNDWRAMTEDRGTEAI